MSNEEISTTPSGMFYEEKVSSPIFVLRYKNMNVKPILRINAYLWKRKKGVNHLNVDVRAEDSVLAHSFLKTTIYILYSSISLERVDLL